MKILISPYSKMMRNGEKNPKNYPYWEQVIKTLVEKGHEVTQIQYMNEGRLPGVRAVVNYTSLKVVEKLLGLYDTYISVDNFFPHLAHFNKKYGVVIWGKSDPEIFGYKENQNLLKDRKYLRSHQFETWEADKFDANVFVDPQIVVEAVEKFAF